MKPGGGSGEKTSYRRKSKAFSIELKTALEGDREPYKDGFRKMEVKWFL